MRIYQIFIEGKDYNEWVPLHSHKVAANSLEEAVAQLPIRTNNRIREVRLLAETN